MDTAFRGDEFGPLDGWGFRKREEFYRICTNLRLSTQYIIDKDRNFIYFFPSNSYPQFVCQLHHRYD